MSWTLWPPQASFHAEQVDWLIGSFGLLMALLAAPVFILSAIYLLRFRHGRRVDRSEAEKGSVWLETSWAVIPFLMVMGFYVWSTRMFLDQQSPPDDALRAVVLAKMFDYLHYAAPLAPPNAGLAAGQPTIVTHARFIEGTAELGGTVAGTNRVLVWIDERHGGTIVNPRPEVYLDTVWY